MNAIIFEPFESLTQLVADLQDPDKTISVTYVELRREEREVSRRVGRTMEPGVNERLVSKWRPVQDSDED